MKSYFNIFISERAVKQSFHVNEEEVIGYLYL
jgi:hypothetical protein